MSAYPNGASRELVQGSSNCPSCGQLALVTIDGSELTLVCDHCLYELRGETTEVECVVSW